MREKEEKPMPPGELTEAEYFEQIVRPSREKTRAKIDHIAEVRAKNLQEAKRKERQRRARGGLFDEEPGGFKLFDDD